MRLALSLRRSLSELAEMPGHEFELWAAFIDSEPIGQSRDDFNFARLRMQIAGIAGAKNIKVDDFLVRWGETQADEPEPVINDPAQYRAAFQQAKNGA